MFSKKHEKPPLREIIFCIGKITKNNWNDKRFSQKVGENHHIFMGKFHKIPRNSLIFSEIL